MDPRIQLAARSRDGHLALRRAERQQALIELLAGAAPRMMTTTEIAHRLDVSPRTVERDLERLRDLGIPFTARRGRGGGHSLTVHREQHQITLDTAEIAAILSSLAIVGPNSSPSSASAVSSLITVLREDIPRAQYSP